MSTVINTLVTDRTEADVAALKALSALGWGNLTPEQKTAWNAGKGAYNASDLNRVGEACSYLYGMFTEYGYFVPGYTVLRTDWTDEDVPTASDMETYLSTVSALKAVLSAAQTIPDSMSGLTVDGANNIEKLLIEVYDQLRRMAQSFIYSGMTYSGVIWSQIGG